MVNNLRHKLSVDLTKKSIQINNLTNLELKIELVDLLTNFCIYSSKIGPLGFSACFYKESNNLKIYIKEKFSGGEDFHIYEISLTNEDFEIKKIDNLSSFNFNNNLIFINGHSGGGTSIVTKLLRYLGAHTGDDSGDLTTRTPYEPYGAKLWIKSLSDEYPINHHKENFLKISHTYNYQDNKVNIIKVPDCYNKLNLLKDIFPNLKVLNIVKKQNEFYHTIEGSKFNTKNQLELYKFMYPHLEGANIFHLDFELFFTDYHYTNKVIKYIGLESIITNEKQFNFIKDNIDFDPKVLE